MLKFEDPNPTINIDIPGLAENAMQGCGMIVFRNQLRDQIEAALRAVAQACHDRYRPVVEAADVAVETQHSADLVMLDRALTELRK